MTPTATTDLARAPRITPGPAATLARGTRRVRVWDLPTRLFHWSLVACLIGLVVTGYVGGAMMDWHALIGYGLLALLLFRVAWGWVGGRWSRFSSFVYSPGSAIAHLRERTDPAHYAGHNPAGAFSIFAMMALLLAQVATGLISDDEIAFTGPLNRFVQASQGIAATWYHKEVGQWLLLAVVLLHIAAVLYYLVHRKLNLIRPMLDGDKQLAVGVPASRDDALTRATAAVLFALCCLAVAWAVGPA